MSTRVKASQSQIAASTSEDLSQVLANVCAGHTVRDILQACMDTIVGTLIFGHECPEDAEGFIAAVPADLRRNMRRDWDYYKKQIAEAKVELQ